VRQRRGHYADAQAIANAQCRADCDDCDVA